MNTINKAKCMIISLLTLFICVGCGAGDDGIEGTGFNVKGTVAVGAAVANSEVKIRDINGKQRSTTTNAQGKYQLDISELEPPFLIKAKLNENQNLYSIAYQAGVANIHPFSDVIVRNWFAHKGRQIDNEFASNITLTDPPTTEEITAINLAIKNILSSAYTDFSLDRNFDFFSSEFDADQTGFDRLLDHININIVVNRFSISIVDPINQYETLLINQLPINKDFSQADSSAPTTPTGLAVIPASNQTMVVVWNVAEDDIGIAGYHIFRDNQLLSSSTFPHYSDNSVTADTEYCYSVQAYDGAGNASASTTTVCASVTSVVDNIAPETASNLQVTAIDDTSFLLTWTAPSDQDVVGYHVFRKSNTDDYERITTVTGTSRLDSNLSYASEFCYKVKALDAFTNESEFSNEVCGTTAKPPSTIIPGDTPTIQFSSLQYQVTEMAGTASIIVTRQGDSSQAVSVDYQLSQGTAIADRDYVDATGTLQWAANDISDKVIYVQIKADTNSEANETVNLQLSSPSSNALLGNPSATVLTIQDADCTGVISNDINTDTIISNPCNIVTEDVSVMDAILTINPGVTLIFEAGTGIDVSQTGALNATGSEAKPILFTAKSPTPGYWRGLRFTFSNDTQNVLEYTTVEFGGNAVPFNANVNLIGSQGLSSQISIKHSTLSDSLGYGFAFSSGSIVRAFSNNRITRNAAGAGSLPTNLLGKLDAASQFIGNPVDQLHVQGDVNENQGWPKFDIPIILESVSVDADLNIAAGNVLLFRDGGGLTISSTGSLNAVGQSDDLIQFTSISQTPGAWQGLNFVFSNDSKNVLEYVLVEYGGAGIGPGANIKITGPIGLESYIKISNSLIRNSDEYGFYFSQGAVIGGFHSNIIKNNEIIGSIDADNVENLDSASDYSGNKEDFIDINSNTLTREQNWKNLNVPYRLGDLTLNASLTLQPGVALYFHPSSELTVSQDAYLNAVGTESEKIRFTGVQTEQGSWAGIRFVFSNSSNNQLIHSEVEYAGLINFGAVYLQGIGQLFSRATIQHSRIAFSDYHGILLDIDSQINEDIETINEFEMIAQKNVHRNN